MLTVNQLAGFGGGAPAVQSQIVTTSLTHIGNHNAGNIAAIDDGVTSQLHTASLQFNSEVRCWTGWDLGSAMPISGAEAWGSSNRGFIETNADTLNLDLRGSNSAPAAATDGASISSLALTDGAGATISKLDITPTSYRYVWIDFGETGGAGLTQQCAELKLYKTE